MSGMKTNNTTTWTETTTPAEFGAMTAAVSVEHNPSESDWAMFWCLYPEASFDDASMFEHAHRTANPLPSHPAPFGLNAAGEPVHIY